MADHTILEFGPDKTELTCDLNEIFNENPLLGQIEDKLWIPNETIERIQEVLKTHNIPQAFVQHYSFLAHMPNILHSINLKFDSYLNELLELEKLQKLKESGHTQGVLKYK